jgi:MFS-type transporter involved in bile tolerance (Atg22 family)
MLFILYSLSLAMTEAAERSLIGDYAPPRERGTAFGFYHLVSGVLVLPGAFAFGFIWQVFGSGTAFSIAALITATAAALMRSQSLRTPMTLT